jgi:putative transposon-encoded protein
MPKVKRIKLCEVIEEKASKAGNSSHVILPLEWLDKKVMVIKLEKVKKNDR